MFKTQTDLKWLLPEDPIILLSYVPLLALGLVLALRRFRRPEHLLVLVVTALTLVANLSAYVVDYRFMNYMPVLFLTMGIGLTAIESFCDRRRAELAVGLYTGLLLLQSVTAYFSHADNSALRLHYGTREVALARQLARFDKDSRAYVLGPNLTWRLEFFDRQNPNIRQPNYSLDASAQSQYSQAGQAAVFANVSTALERDAQRPGPLHLVLALESPYTQSLTSSVSTRLGLPIRSLEVTDVVSRKTESYAWIAIPAEVKAAAAQLQNQPALLPAPGWKTSGASRGQLLLETFSDAAQTILTDRRVVPAAFDFDFVSTSPYAARWDSNFALRWSGYMYVDKTGPYQIAAEFDDSCRVALDDHTVISEWNPVGARSRVASVSLEQGWHSIRIDYFQLISAARLSLRISPDAAPGAPIQAASFAAEALLERALGDPLAAFNQGIAFFDKKQYEEASRYFRLILDKFPRGPNADSANYFLAICHFKRSEWNETIRLFRELIRNYPASPIAAEAHYHIAWCQHLNGDKAAALETFRLVVEQFPASRWRGYSEEWIRNLEASR
ncbi:MAG: tetratricopeptide repeat protein [Acidobacteriota bacterium]